MRRIESREETYGRPFSELEFPYYMTPDSYEEWEYRRQNLLFLNSASHHIITEISGERVSNVKDIERMYKKNYARYGPTNETMLYTNEEMHIEKAQMCARLIWASTLPDYPKKRNVEYTIIIGGVGYGAEITWLEKISPRVYKDFEGKGVGIDVVEEGLAIARANHPGYTFLKESIEEHQREKQYRWGVLCGVLNAIPNPLDVANEMWQRIQPGGTLILDVNSRNYDIYFNQKSQELTDKGMLGLHTPSRFSKFDIQTLKDELKTNRIDYSMHSLWDNMAVIFLIHKPKLPTVYMDDPVVPASKSYDCRVRKEKDRHPLYFLEPNDSVYTITDPENPVILVTKAELYRQRIVKEFQWRRLKKMEELGYGPEYR